MKQGHHCSETILPVTESQEDIKENKNECNTYCKKGIDLNIGSHDRSNSFRTYPVFAEKFLFADVSTDKSFNPSYNFVSTSSSTPVSLILYLVVILTWLRFHK